MKVTSQLCFLFFISMYLTSCDQNHTDSNNTHKSAIYAKEFSTDKWLGKWNGPEGTFLTISGGNGKYEIVIQDLDGPKTYPGISVNNTIEFERNNVKQIIRATNGAETGMKWLADKTDCLTVHYGEGYCK